MKKGIVLALDKTRATLFTEQCELVRVRCQPHMALGREVAVEPARERVWTAKPLQVALAALSLVLVLAVVLLAGQSLLVSPVYATISIDINPSLELDLNQALTVMAVRAMNEDAAALLTGLELKGLDWEEAVRRWTEQVRQQTATAPGTVLISVVMPQTATQLQERLLVLEDQLQQEVRQQTEVRVLYTHDTQVTRQAHQNELSVGRQMLLNQSRAQNQAWNEASIATASLGELVRMLLRGEDRDQTGLTVASAAQTLAETLHSGEMSGSGATQRETNRETTGTRPEQSGTQPTSRATNRETSGSYQGDTTGSQMTSRVTDRPEASTETYETSASGQPQSSTPATSQNGQTAPSGPKG
jgi:hypothetical protein